MIATKVLIAGGGPTGLMIAIELGRRGVPCVLVEEDAEPPSFPKANATTSRTMEHYRRLGFAHEIRALGLTPDHPQDIAYFTRFSTCELARVRGRSRAEAAQAREGPYSRWPTPEPLHRANQMYIERVLRAQVSRWAVADARFGWRLAGFVHDAEGVLATIEEVGTGRTEAVRAAYLCGCDGPRSIVRRTLGIEYAGWSGEERAFLGGRMLAVYFRSPQFYDVVPYERAWQYWAVNRERRGLIAAIDGEGLFVYGVQLPPGQAPDEDFARASLALSTGRAFPFELIGLEPWTAGYTLVAERYQDPHGRVFIAGDAAHLFTPTGGQGYNTAIDDAANLAWKLAARVQGWGGAGLLATYETERRPIGERNTRFARAMADSIGRMPVPAEIEEDSPAGARARGEVGAALLHHCNVEFDIPGIHLGVFYGASSIVIGDGTPPPDDAWNHYRPHATPGARAPHLWLADDVALFDRFGREFTLLRLGPRPPAVHGFVDAASALGMPLTILDCPGDEARTLYGADLVLVRPDHHVAWRGNAAADAPEVLTRVAGA